MRILFLSAVEFELDAARRAWGGGDAEYLATGIGAEATVRALEEKFGGGSIFDRVVDLGVAGSSTERFPIGSVVHVTRERHGENPAAWFVQESPWPELGFLPSASGHTLQELSDHLRSPGAEIETMEGAAFFETCLRHGIPFAEIRAVSNRVGERDHALWDISLALRNLETALRTLKTLLK